MLGDRTWQPKGVAALLGCSEDEAQAVLWAYGFADVGGDWTRRADGEAAVLDVVFEEIGLSYELGHDDFEETLRGRVLPEQRRASARPFSDGVKYGDDA